MITPFPAQVFFAANPDQAKVKAGKRPGPDDLRGVVMKANASVNRAIKPRKEKSDKWAIYPKDGDCDDYAVTKRHELIKQGFGSAYLRIAFGNLPSGEAHAVLIVDSSAGAYVLDNLTNSLIPKSQSNISWSAIQSASNPTKFEAYK